jgi:phosphoglycerate dehydrogenase-like enzyme
LQDCRIAEREGKKPSIFPSCNPAILHSCNVMNVVVGVISPAPAWVMPRQHVDRLRSDFAHHTFLEAWDRDMLRQLLPEADVAFTPFIDRDIFPSASRLRWVQSPAAGVGGLMFPELLASPVILTSARGIRARSIAEHVLGVTIALARLMPATLRAQAAHRWAQDELEMGARTLQGLRMGIVGLGAIGLEVAKVAAPFGFRITAIRRRGGQPPPDGVDAVWTPDRLPDLLAQSDVLILAVPHTPETKRLIGRTQIERMKQGALLVNVARGKLVDDEALVAALRDVFSEEPLEPFSPYWDLPNVIVTPHTAGAMQDYWTPLVALFAENLRRFEKGEPLLNVVDKVAGY